MDLWLAALTILGAAALSAGAMLIVLWRAPGETYFRRVIPARAVYTAMGAFYTVVGTAYMVIVAFVFLIAFQSYDAAKSDAEAEATATLGMFHLASLFGPQAAERLEEQTICYAREVISAGWPAMRRGTGSPVVEARVTALEQTAGRLPLRGERQRAAYDHWFSLSEDRRRGRQGRIAAASPLVPPLIWMILIIGGVVVIGTICLFAHPKVAWFPQAVVIASVALLVVSGVVLVRFLDTPYENRSGSIKPTAMERTLALMQKERHERGRGDIRCA